MIIPDRYIGDGVYASFDGYQIWLKAGGVTNDDAQIALEPEVYASLVSYVADLKLALDKARASATKDPGP